MRKFTLLAAVAAIALSAATVEAKSVLKIQATASAGDWVQSFYTKWADKYNAMTGADGAKIEILPFQAVVPYRETLDAAASGLLAGDFSAISYFTGRDQVFSIMGDLIAGYDTVEQVQTFYQFGGGKEMMQKIYDKTLGGKLHVVGCGPFAREALVSSKPIRGVDDMKGIKIRSPEGLAAEVFKRVGATPVALPYSEVFTSIEKGVVDAADASSYVNNVASGFHKVAKYPIYPGIHSMAVFQLAIGKRTWNKMSEADRATMEVWFPAMLTALARASDLEDKRLAEKDRAGGKVTVIDWPQAERDKFRKIAMQAWKDVAAKSPLAAEALEAHVTFMKQIGLLD